MIDWVETRRGYKSQIGEVIWEQDDEIDSGWWICYHDKGGCMSLMMQPDKKMNLGFADHESAKAAVVQAELDELQRRAAQIDCAVVEDKELKRLRRIEILHDCVMNDKPVPELPECLDEGEPILQAIKKMPNQDFKILKDGE